MVPEILIVADASRREELGHRVEALGYDATCCTPSELTERLEGGPAPAAIVVAVGDEAAPRVMADLRRIPSGVAVPVTLTGVLGGLIRDLADVLDLGADHFLEEPVRDEQLLAALEALAGPPARPSSSTPAEPLPDPLVDREVPSTTEVLDGGQSSEDVVRGRGAAPVAMARGRDPVIGRLHRTLDLLEDRLRSRSRSPSDARGSDDLERSLLELSPVPLHADVELPDPSESHSALEIVPMAPEPDPSESDDGTESRQATVMLEAARLEVDAGSVRSGRITGAERGPAAVDEERVPDGSSARWPQERPRRAAPLPLQREGTLDKIEVPRLLWKLHRSGFTGRVDLTLGRASKRIWLERGEVTFARSNLEHDRLVDALFRRGMLTREQYETARRLAAKEPRRSGQLLVTHGLLKSDELPRVLREHLTRIVDSTFGWNGGTWRIEPGDRCEEAITLQAPFAMVVFDGIRGRLDRAQLWGLVGGPHQFPVLSSSPSRTELAQSLRLTEAEVELLAGMDGRHSLEQIATESRRAGRGDELELLTLVYGLSVLELLTLEGEPRPEPQAAVDPADVDRARIAERLRLAREADYFELLGLPRDAGGADARRAYADLGKTFSDDALEPEVRTQLRSDLSEIRCALAEAAEVLADEALRNAYLAHLEEP